MRLRLLRRVIVAGGFPEAEGAHGDGDPMLGGLSVGQTLGICF